MRRGRPLSFALGSGDGSSCGKQRKKGLLSSHRKISLLVGCIVLVGLVSLFGGEDGEATFSNGTPSSTTYTRRLSAALAHGIFGAASYVTPLAGTVSVIIVVVSVIFTEAAFEFLNHMTEDSPFKELVAAIEGELMVVGTMAFLFKIIVNLTQFINNEWLLALEYADLLVPIITFSRCLIGVGLIYVSIVVCKNWGKAYHFHHLEILEAYLDKHNMWCGKSRASFVLPLSVVNAQLEFRVFHAIFIEQHHIQRSEFAFDEYVHLIFEKYLLRIIGMHEFDWFLICICVLLNWGRVTFKLDINNCVHEDAEVSHYCEQSTNMTNFCLVGLTILLVTLVLACVSRYYELKILATRGVTSCDDFAMFLDQAELQQKTRAEKEPDKSLFNASELKAAVVEARQANLLAEAEKESSLDRVLLRSLSNLFDFIKSFCFKKPTAVSRAAALFVSAEGESVEDFEEEPSNEVQLKPTPEGGVKATITSIPRTLLDFSTRSESMKAKLKSEKEDLSGIFFFSWPSLYFGSVSLMIMPMSFYIALWITNFVENATELEDALKWQFLSILPGIVSTLVYLYVTRVASLLLAVTELDNDAVEEIIDQTEGAHQLQLEVREKILSRLESRGNDPQVELRNFFESIDDDNSGLLSRNEFQIFLNKMKISFTKKKWMQIFAEIDRDNSGQVDFEELFIFIFPESYKATRLERMRLRRIQENVNKKAKNMMNDSPVGSSKYNAGSATLQQIVKSTKLSADGSAHIKRANFLKSAKNQRPSPKASDGGLGAPGNTQPVQAGGQGGSPTSYNSTSILEDVTEENTEWNSEP